MITTNDDDSDADVDVDVAAAAAISNLTTPQELYFTYLVFLRRLFPSLSVFLTYAEVLIFERLHVSLTLSNTNKQNDEKCIHCSMCSKLQKQSKRENIDKVPYFSPPANDCQAFV